MRCIYLSEWRLFAHKIISTRTYEYLKLHNGTVVAPEFFNFKLCDRKVVTRGVSQLHPALHSQVVVD